MKKIQTIEEWYDENYLSEDEAIIDLIRENIKMDERLREIEKQLVSLEKIVEAKLKKSV